MAFGDASRGKWIHQAHRRPTGDDLHKHWIGGEIFTGNAGNPGINGGVLTCKNTEKPMDSGVQIFPTPIH